jgi:hypothetical protein
MQPGNPGQDPYGQQPPSGDQPPQYGQQPQYGQPPQYGQQPPQYGDQPPQYGQQPPQYGDQPPQYGAPQYPDPYSQQPSSPPPGQPYPSAPAYPAGSYGPPAGQQPSNTLGLVSMILGIASIPLLCCFSLGLPLGIAAAVMGYLGKKRADQGLATNRGQAQAGFICGAIAAGLGIVLIVLSIVLNTANWVRP